MLNAGKQLFVACYRKLQAPVSEDKGGYGLNDRYPAMLEKALAGDTINKVKHSTIDVGKMLKPVFKKQSFQNYISEAKKTGNFIRFEEAGGAYPDLLARICGFEDFNHFVGTYTSLDDAEIIKTLKKIFGKTWTETSTKNILENFERFEAIEFEKPGVRISCISYDLLWAAEYIPKKTKEILKIKNEYRYILTDATGKPHWNDLKQELEEIPALRRHVKIKFLEDLKEQGDFKGLSMIFPICNDIVVYEELVGGRYVHTATIIGVNSKKNENFESFVVEIDKKRGLQILYWFNSIWNKLPKT